MTGRDGDRGGRQVPAVTSDAGPDGAAPLRVLIADDQAVVRLGFTALLESQADLTVVGSAGDGEQAVRLAGQVAPRRGPDGHPDAGHGRHRRDRAAHRRRRRRRGSSC